MKKINLIIKSLSYSCMLFIFSSCYFLDVSDELAGNLTQEQVFNDPAYTRRWHRNILQEFPTIPISA